MNLDNFAATGLTLRINKSFTSSQSLGHLDIELLNHGIVHSIDFSHAMSRHGSLRLESRHRAKDSSALVPPCLDVEPMFIN